MQSLVFFTCLHFKTKVTNPSACRARHMPKWLYRPGGRPPLGPADGCHVGMWAQYCQVFLLSRRVRNPEFSVFYTLAINLKNVEVCTSPTNYICGPRLAQRPLACNLSSEVSSGAICSSLCSCSPGVGARGTEGWFNEPLCLAGLLQTGYVTVGGCPEAPCGPETMYKRNGLMASVSVTSATPQVQRFWGRGRGGPPCSRPGPQLTRAPAEPRTARLQGS